MTKKILKKYVDNPTFKCIPIFNQYIISLNKLLESIEHIEFTKFNKT